MSQPLELQTSLIQEPLQRLLNDATVRVNSFSVKTLKSGLGNPTSLGVYRVSGESTAGPFSMVVKHLAPGADWMDASQPDFWNYWLREIEFFESPIADRIPSSLGFPKYLGQTRFQDGTALFWNSDLGDLEKFTWTWEQCLDAARLVAELNSIDSSDLDEYIWLNRSQPEGWLVFREDFFFPFLPKVIESSKRTAELSAAYEVYGPWLPKQELMGELLHSGRQSFMHGDFNLNNLVPTNGKPSVIALDWQLCGVGRVGMEVASILNTAVELGFVAGNRDQFEEICLVYTERFNELNSDEAIGLDEVRLAAAVAGQWILSAVGFFLSHPQTDESVEQVQAKLDRMVDNFSADPMMTYCRVLEELL